MRVRVPEAFNATEWRKLSAASYFSWFLLASFVIFLDSFLIHSPDSEVLTWNWLVVTVIKSKLRVIPLETHIARLRTITEESVLPTTWNQKCPFTFRLSLVHYSTRDFCPHLSLSFRRKEFCSRVVQERPRQERWLHRYRLSNARFPFFRCAPLPSPGQRLEIELVQTRAVAQRRWTPLAARNIRELIS